MRVSDLATVRMGAPDRTSLIAGQGGNAIAISVSQQVGANVLTVRRGVEEALNELKTSLPAGLRLVKTYDLAEFVQSAIANVRDAILIGAGLAVLVLLLFLRNWRLTLVAACTLPLTVVSTFFFMWVFGESINLMSMGGMAVAIGLVIDDAVVVVENIHRRLSEGGGAEAVEQATGELVAPIVGSTLTTVVVFAPLGLLSGVVGDFFKALSITLSVAVLISMVLALYLIPLLASASYRAAPGKAHAPDQHGVVDRWYVATLPFLLKRPALALLIAVILGGAAVAAYLPVGSGFLPAADEGGFVIDYLTPAGMALEDTDARLKRVEAILTTTPEVASYVRRTGSELGNVCDPDEQRRRPGPAQAARRSDAIGRRDHHRSPRQADSGGPGYGDRVRPAAPGHAGGPRRKSHTDRGQGIWRRPGAAGRALRSDPDDASRRSRVSWIWSGSRKAAPSRRGPSIRWRRRGLG